MVGVTSNATFDGKPLAVLTNLLRKRQRILNESAKDAVVATGIDVLVSLRALTKIAKKRIPKADVRFGKTDPKYTTYPRGSYRRVVVTRWRDGKKVNLIKWQKVEGTTKRGKPKAVPADRVKAWERWGKIGNRGLAKTALGVAMKSISTRNPADKVTPRALRLAKANVSVKKYDGDNGFMLEINDSLNYAALALKGGPSAIDVAMRKAANKIAGRLSKVAAVKLGEKIPTPFPEVKQRRAG